MKTIWDWLEIDFTTDKQTIKKAYAKQAKKYHPEENPEEFKQLRNAYKTAMEFVSSSIVRESFIMADEAAADAKKAEGSEGARAGEAKGLEGGEGERADAERKLEAGEYERIGRAEALETLDASELFEASEERREGAEKNEEDNKYTYSLARNGSNDKSKGEQSQDWQYQDERHSEQSQGRQYQYGLQGEQPQSRQHQSEQPQDWQEQHFVYNQGSQRDFDFEMQQRLSVFLKRVDIIYVNNSMCDNIKAWKMLFNYYECKNDFNNHAFVAAVVDTFEKMPGIDKKIRMYIGKQLFASNDNDVTIRYLKERYYDQQSYTIKRDPQQPQKNFQLRDIARKLYGRQHKAYKRYNFINNCISIISACVFGIMFTLAYKSSRYDDDKYEKPQMTMSTKFLRETQGEIVVLEKLEIYKSAYTKETPFISDLNSDGYADRVYYDGDTDQFLVEEYNPEILDYIQVGNVDDYCIKNIKARVKLFRFLQEDE